VGARIVSKKTLLSRWLAVSLVVMVVTSAGVVFTSAAFFQARLLSSHLLRAQAVAASMKVQLERLLALGIEIDRIQGFEEQCREVLANNANVSEAMVIGKDGRVLFHSDPDRIGQSLRDAGLWQALSAGAEQGSDGTERYFGADSVSELNSGDLLAHTVVVFPASVISGEITRLLVVSMGVALLLVAIGALVLRWFFAQVVSRPVVGLLRSVDRLRRDDNAPGQRLQHADVLEVDRVVDGFNRLLDRVDLHEIELLKARDQAEAANEAKSAFLANMSHELRTPLHAIIGMTNIAVRKVEDPKGRTYLDKSLQAAKRLMGIINDMLDIAAIESQRLKIEAQPFTVRELIDEQVQLVTPMVGEKSLRIEVSIDEQAAGTTLSADPLRIGQVVLNLLSNAIKFSEVGLIQVVVTLVAETPAQRQLRVEVRDSGIGIPEAQLKSIFEPFEQVDTSSTRKYGGTGLGLAISAKLVGLMGGRIGCKSVEGVGSAFWFTVPVDLLGSRQPADVVERPIPVPPAQDFTLNDRVLLVEDDEDNQLVAREYLADLGLPCEVAADGDQALELCRRYRFAIILMDIQLPGMDGFECTRRIRDLRGYARVPIIAMSANAFESDRLAAAEAGMNDFLAKPAEQAGLQAVLQRWMVTGRVMSGQV